MTMHLFRFSNVQKDYGARRVLDITRFELHPGRCVLLSGKNGSGKTTLLKILAGLETPDRACVVNGTGVPQTWSRARAVLRRSLVYLHQTPYMFDASVEDNIRYGLKHLQVAAAEQNRRLRTALQWAGLEHMAKADAKRLSGGERQRVAIARASVLQPRALLLDEPTANMDQSARARTVELLARLKESQLSIVITSHEPQGLATLADERVRIEAGRIAPEASPDNEAGVVSAREPTPFNTSRRAAP